MKAETVEQILVLSMQTSDECGSESKYELIFFLGGGGLGCRSQKRVNFCSPET